MLHKVKSELVVTLNS